jgi:sugar lactone lactonase YvrE
MKSFRSFLYLRFPFLLILSLLAAGNLTRADSPLYRVTTLAGAVYDASVDGTGISARFSSPNGTAVDGAGNIYVADSGNHTVRKITPTGVVTTLAGLPGVPGSSDGVGTTARFYSPNAVAVDGTGNVFVADVGNFTIRKITSAGVVTTFAGAAGQSGNVDGTGASARFGFTSGKTGLVVDSVGNLYVADGNIRKITTAGVVTTLIKQGAPVSYPYDPSITLDHSMYLGIDAADNLYSNEDVLTVNGAVKISPAGAAQVIFRGGVDGNEGLTVDNSGHVYTVDEKQILSKDGVPLAGSPTAYYNGPTFSVDGAKGTLGFPVGLSVDNSSGKVYFSDQNTNSIRFVAPNGLVGTLAGETDDGSIDGAASIARFTQPAGLALDAAGNIYVTDWASSIIRKVATDGTVTTVAGSASQPGNNDGQGANARFSFPQAVALDGAGSLYVADRGNNTIRKIDSAGNVTTLAGTSGQSGNVDGAGAAARFNNPTGIAVDSNGNVFVCDSGNQTIRQITASGLVSTYAGIPGPGNTTRVDGPVASARFIDPKSAAIDRSGNLWIAEGDFNGIASEVVRKITPAGIVSTLSINESPTASIEYPTIAVDTIGNVFLTTHDAILEFNSSGHATSLQTPEGTLSPEFPFNRISVQNTGLAVDSNGNVYFTDGTNTLRKATPLSSASAALAFNSQPAGSTINQGDTVSLSGSATGNQPISYQWHKDGRDIPGATNSTLNITGAVAANSGVYYLVASNSTGVIASNTATIVVKATPVNDPNAAQPLPKTVTAGHAATFSAGAASGSIQWQVSSNSGSTWTNLTNDATYSGAATATLTVSNASSALNGTQYRYVVTNNGATTTSSAATLSVAQAFFPFPTAIAADSAGNLFVADANTDTIQKINSSGQVSLIAGASGTAGSTDGSGTAARFNQPAGLIALSSGVLIVGDTANATIRSIAITGTVTTLAGNAENRGGANGAGSAATFLMPIGIAADANGNLYVADAMNDIVRKISPTGTVSTLAGTTGATGSADGSGQAARFNYPTGVVSDGSGNIYLSDTTNNLIRKITPTGSVSTLAGLAGVSGSADGTGSEALFNHPGGLALDSSGNLYLADTANSTIRKINSAGTVTTLAGLPGIAGLQDGTGTSAFFNQPQALALDSGGNLYVADTGNATIRKVTPAGVVTTLALAAAPVSGGSSSSGTTSGSGGRGGTTPSSSSSGSSGGGGGGGSVGSLFGITLAALAMARLGFAKRSKT